MKREIFLVQNTVRMKELVESHVSQVGDTVQDGALAIGFYCVQPAKKTAGIEINVTPSFLKTSILDLVEQGQFAPLEESVFLWVDEKKEQLLSRWLMLGLNSVVNNLKNQNSSLFENASAIECVRDFLNHIFKNVIELRPNFVVFLFDVEAFSKHLSTLGISTSSNEVFDEMLSWLVEDCIHPSLALLFKNEEHFKRASQSVHTLAHKGLSHGVRFGF